MPRHKLGHRTSVLRAVVRFLRSLQGPAGIVVHDAATLASASFHLPQALVETVEEHAPPNLNEMESCIVEAIGLDTLTGEQVAAKAGYPYDGGFKQCLASLRRRGILGNKAPGYYLSQDRRSD